MGCEPILLTEFYKTRGGYKAKIYALNCGGEYPVHGAVKWEDRWVQVSWTTLGYRFLKYCDHFDIVEVWRPKRR